jgi:membrane protease YdiL (CAAX protease family)
MDNWPRLFEAVLPHFLIMVLLFNFTEEVGWTGLVQSRLQDRHGPLRAVALTTVIFALWHVPDVWLDEGLSLSNLPVAFAIVGVLALSQVFGRIFIMWLYNGANRSVLIVGLFHAGFNTTVAKATFGGAFVPSDDGGNGTVLLIASLSLAIAAVSALLLTRGGLGYMTSAAAQSSQAQPPSR